MLKTNVCIITDRKEKYVNFIEILKQHFDGLKVYCSKNDFVDSISREYLDCCSAATSLLVLFVEFSFLSSMSDFLNKRLPPSNYILVIFNSGACPQLSSYKNVFELINTDSAEFYADFFISKLQEEISSRSKFLLLQFEVRKFYEIGKSLSSEKDTMKLFEMIIESSLNLTSSDAGTIYLVIDRKNGNWSSIRNNNFSDKQLKFVIARNSSMDIKLEASTSEIFKESISGYTVITGRPLRINDAYNLDPVLDYHHDRSYDQASGYVTKSMLCIPMKDHENNVMGVIQLINKKKYMQEKLDMANENSLKNIIPYDYEDELIMNSLAGQAAVALENNLLYRDMRSILESYKIQNSQLEFLSRKILRAHEEERKRIAREIHDGPAQSIVNLSLKLELCKKYLQIKNLEKLSDELISLSSSIKSVTKEIRTIIYDLKPSYLEDGLIKALENHFSIFSENTNINVAFSISGDDGKIEYYMTSTIYRIVQEAFTNIYKHAEATKVNVRLEIDENSLFLTIVDNGKGFDVSALEKKNNRRLESGFGLEGIKERLELISGNIAIKSWPGHGTQLTINVPLR